jgi:hypothetical protein
VLAGGQPTGQWWVYRAYAQLGGKLLATSGGDGVAVASAADAGAQRVLALVGNNSGQGGSTALDFTGLGATPYLLHDGAVHVTVQRIPDQSPLTAPATVFDSDVTPSGGTVHVPLTLVSGTDAYTVALTPGNGTTGPVTGTVTIDGNDTATGDTDHFSYGANWGLTTGVPDMYDGTANWSYVGGAAASLHFTGSKVALHAVRDVDQGRMSLALDGGTPVTVDDWAPSRNASGVVWTSPQLASGAHTLTITNTGAHNQASSGDNIAVDSADITTP